MRSYRGSLEDWLAQDEQLWPNGLRPQSVDHEWRWDIAYTRQKSRKSSQWAAHKSITISIGLHVMSLLVLSWQCKCVSLSLRCLNDGSQMRIHGCIKIHIFLKTHIQTKWNFKSKTGKPEKWKTWTVTCVHCLVKLYTIGPVYIMFMLSVVFVICTACWLLRFHDFLLYFRRNK